MLLIPVEKTKTVKWVAGIKTLSIRNRVSDCYYINDVFFNKKIDEAARRYYNMTGLNPVLSLQTDDGAVLNGEDVVSLILQDGDKIVGDMVKWDLQPLPERYANLCKQLQVG